MSRFVLALCTCTMALGLALALPTFSSAAVPVNVAPAAALQPVAYRYPRAYHRYGSWRWYRYHGHRNWHYRR